MSFIEKIEVKGFKSIKDAQMDIKPLNILIGANGSGKSNFLFLFHLLNQIIEEKLQLFVGTSGGSDKLLYFGRKNTNEIFIHINFGNNAYSCTLAPAADDTLIFGDETVSFYDPKYSRRYPEFLGKGHKESLLKGNSRIEKYVMKAIKNWKIYHFHDTSDSAKIKQMCDIGDNEFLRFDASNLAAFLYLLKDTKTEYYRNIIDTIRMAAPFFDDFNLRPWPHNPSKIKIEWREKNSDSYFDASSLSDGTLRFICLTTLLLQPELPSTIILDEPELGLHPYAISVLAELLRSASEKSQIIVSTQSVTLVNQFTPNDIIVVERREGSSLFNRLNEDALSEWLKEYGLGELWEKNIIGGRPA